MVVEAKRLPFESLARVAERLATGISLAEALELLAGAAEEMTGADLAVVRVLDDEQDMLVARAVAPAGSLLAAEVSGSRVEPAYEVASRRLLVPARVGGTDVGAIELIRLEGEFDQSAVALAGLIAAQLALALTLLPGSRPRVSSETRLAGLARTGEALAAGAELERAARQAVREAKEATGAEQAAIWQSAGDGLELVASDGIWDSGVGERARTLALEVRSVWRPLVVEDDPVDSSFMVSIRLGEPAFGVLQLRYAGEPTTAELDALAAFAARVAHALRLGTHARDVELELERTRALLSVVAEAIARLSLAHTLETSVERIAALLGIDGVGIYLLEEQRLQSAAGRGLASGHENIAQVLLALATGPLRARETIDVRPGEGRGDRPLARAARVLSAAGVESALAVPLRVHDETIGLLIAFPGARRATEGEQSLLAALAAQLAVAVQNARLHEEAKELGEALSSVLASERQAARRLRALYEISNTFTSSLSLEATLQAVTETVVDVLGIDAAVIRVPDDRGDALLPSGVHVADGRLADAVRTILNRPQARWHLTQPLKLTEHVARRLGGAQTLLVPFLAKGSTAVVIPISTQTELLAHLTILSLDPANPISAETITTATTIAGQAALALDNARLYQQQKQFAETIQRALLPGVRPDVAGLDVGAVYESAARLDVGGDVYDFLELGEGRLALVLGDVTGHGVDATADMAMAKFVFRSLAREHSEPSDFLAHANEVIAGEIGLGKFITMVYLSLDSKGRAAVASAGHPAPRLVMADGTVEPLTCRGLALGIEGGQVYEQVEAELPAGAAVVLYTDGVIEARSGSELYGEERLDACLAERAQLPAQALAAAVLADCRAFAGGELRDDCAIVVARKT
jgi:serine phosphatase RsbU (regulator of sigma subunit)